MYRGELCAYFPTLEWSRDTITCYVHVGQHGGADRSWLQRGRPASLDEYAPLLGELESIYGADPDPVTLKVYRRDPSRMFGRIAA
jgi:hypothetical protein